MIPRYLVERMTAGHLLHHFLLGSYCYYILSQSPMDDSTFDRICQRLYELYDSLEHQHKYLVSKDDLQAGTGYALRDDDYPLMVQLSAMDYLRRCVNGEVERDLLKVLDK